MNTFPVLQRYDRNPQNDSQISFRIADTLPKMICQLGLNEISVVAHRAARPKCAPHLLNLLIIGESSVPYLPENNILAKDAVESPLTALTFRFSVREGILSAMHDAFFNQRKVHLACRENCVSGSLRRAEPATIHIGPLAARGSEKRREAASTTRGSPRKAQRAIRAGRCP